MIVTSNANNVIELFGLDADLAKLIANSNKYINTVLNSGSSFFAMDTSKLYYLYKEKEIDIGEWKTTEIQGGIIL